MPYTVTLDSVPWSSVRQPVSSALFYSTIADDATHDVSITPASLLDSIVIQMDLDADTITSMDDSQLWGLPADRSQGSLRVTGNWTKNACLGSGRSQNTCHVTNGANDGIAYTFEGMCFDTGLESSRADTWRIPGDAITVWGSLENARARYSVSIDGSAPQSFSKNNGTSTRPSTVLAHASNLGSGSHVLELFSNPLDGTSKLEIDFVQVYSMTNKGAGM